MTDDVGHSGDSQNGTTPKGLEERIVEAKLQGVSADANEQLTTELRQVIGKDRVQVPQDRPHVERMAARRGSAFLGDGRFIFHMTIPAAAVIGAIVALTGGSWCVLPVAFVVLLLATYNVVGFTNRLTSLADELAPTTNALLEAEGVGDPERLFSDLVTEFTEEDAAGST